MEFAERENMRIDPVCKKEVKEDNKLKVVLSQEHGFCCDVVPKKGDYVFYFCTIGCKTDFEQCPGDYLKRDTYDSNRIK